MDGARKLWQYYCTEAVRCVSLMEICSREWERLWKPGCRNGLKEGKGVSNSIVQPTNVGGTTCDVIKNG